MLSARDLNRLIWIPSRSMQFYRTYGAKKKLRLRILAIYSRQRECLGLRRFGSVAYKLSAMACNTCGSIPAVSIRAVVLSSQRLSIPCSMGTKMPPFVMHISAQPPRWPHPRMEMCRKFLKIVDGSHAAGRYRNLSHQGMLNFMVDHGFILAVDTSCAERYRTEPASLSACFETLRQL